MNLVSEGARVLGLVSEASGFGFTYRAPHDAPGDVIAVSDLEFVGDGQNDLKFYTGIAKYPRGNIHRISYAFLGDKLFAASQPSFKTIEAAKKFINREMKREKENIKYPNWEVYFNIAKVSDLKLPKG